MILAKYSREKLALVLMAFTCGIAAHAQGGTQRVWLGDPGVGMQQAMSLNIPSGWQFQGQMIRNVPCSPGDAFAQLRVSSPDGAYSMSTMTPFFTTPMPTTFDLRSCGVVSQPMSAANILSRYIVPATRKGAQVSAPQAVPGGEKFVRNNSGNRNGTMFSADAARVHVSYNQNGQAVEEYIVALTTVMRQQGMSSGISSSQIIVYKAPAGKLDGFFQQAFIGMSLTPDPQWQQRNAQLTAQQTQQAQQQGQQQRAAIQQNGQDAGAAGRAMLAQTRNNINATGQASMNAAAASEAARHTSAVGTANYVGNQPTQVYFFCNASGQHRTNNNPNPPGPGWYACNN